MDFQDLQTLIARYNADIATLEERQRVEEWYDQIGGPAPDISAEQVEATRKELHDAILVQAVAERRRPRRVRRLFAMVSSAAVFILIVSGGWWFFSHQQQRVPKNEHPAVVLERQDIGPVGNVAVLTLADGKRIMLNEAVKGKIAREENTIILKPAEGQVVYKVLAGASIASHFNTIATPRGGQYRVTLPDGSLVYLNAASSIRFPTEFSGAERKVELTGEAYFEVAKDQLPFRVTALGQQVEVLGTHFNINAYGDEPSVRTTLLEGSVLVRQGKAATLLQPGQQCVLTLSKVVGRARINVVNGVDEAEVLAWKNGHLQFDEADIGTIMRQISRWYAVEVEFKGPVPGGHFNGQIPRAATLSQALTILKFNGIHCVKEGRKVIVQ